MTWKWIGAMFVILGCSGVGFSIAAEYRQQELFLQKLIRAIFFMENDLKYRLTPLPDLCLQAGTQAGGSVKAVLHTLAQELATQRSADAGSCMTAALERNSSLPLMGRKHLIDLGNCLGRFDLSGQLQGLEAIRDGCQKDLYTWNQNRENRLRSYRTLGICTGISLAILFA